MKISKSTLWKPNYLNSRFVRQKVSKYILASWRNSSQHDYFVWKSAELVFWFSNQFCTFRIHWRSSTYISFVLWILIVFILFVYSTFWLSFHSIFYLWVSPLYVYLCFPFGEKGFLVTSTTPILSSDLILNLIKAWQNLKNSSAARFFFFFYKNKTNTISLQPNTKITSTEPDLFAQLYFV